MDDHSDRLLTRQLLVRVLAFFADEPGKQVEQVSEFYREIGQRCPKYDLQHPLVELSDWICKVPWTDDSPQGVVPILEEIDAVTTLMFLEKELTAKFTSPDALEHEPAWRVVRKLAAEAIRVGGFDKPTGPTDFIDLVLTVAD